jgi:hypothetical protein
MVSTEGPNGPKEEARRKGTKRQVLFRTEDVILVFMEAVVAESCVWRTSIGCC